MAIKKVCLGLLGLFMVSFAIVMTILFLNDYSLIVLSEDVAEFFKTFQVVFTSIAILFALIYWVLAFINDGFTDYRLHDIAGVIGSAMFMAAFLGMIWSVDLSYLFILGGVFCLYCVLIPLVTSFSGKFSNEKWEPALIWAVIFSVSKYGMSTFSLTASTLNLYQHGMVTLVVLEGLPGFGMIKNFFEANRTKIHFINTYGV